MPSSLSPVLTPIRPPHFRICQGSGACGQATSLLTFLGGAHTIALCEVHLAVLAAAITEARTPHAVPEFPVDAPTPCSLGGAGATNATRTVALCQEHFDISVS